MSVTKEVTVCAACSAVVNRRVSVRLTIALACAFVASPLTAQVLTPTEIDAAVKAGQAGAFPATACVARGAAGGLFSGSFTVRIEGPMGHIMRLSAFAKRQYKPFTMADVTDDMLAPVLRLIVTPDEPTRRGGTLVTTPLAQHVVLKAAKGPDVVQPLELTPMPVEWGNLFGARVAGQGLVASFPLDAFRALPDGEVAAVIVTDGHERRCTLPVKQRATFR